MEVVILGARGSVPVSGPQYQQYGGATACVLVRLGSDIIILDAGSGILQLPAHLKQEEKRLSIFLTHPHIDHMIGIPLCPVLYDKTYTIRMYAAVEDSNDCQALIRELMHPPLWPVGPEAFSARCFFPVLDTASEIVLSAGASVTAMQLPHPGGCIGLRVEQDGKSIVYMTDCELSEEDWERCTKFAANTDLLLIDGQFFDEEYISKRGFGHNSWSMASDFAQDCKAKETLLFHHSPYATDSLIAAQEEQLAGRNLKIRAAKEGEKIIL